MAVQGAQLGPNQQLSLIYASAMAEAKGIARLVQKQAGRAKEKVRMIFANPIPLHTLLERTCIPELDLAFCILSPTAWFKFRCPGNLERSWPCVSRNAKERLCATQLSLKKRGEREVSVL